MKNFPSFYTLLLVVATMFGASNLSAQWTWASPFTSTSTSASVGIGTSTPIGNLSVNGNKIPTVDIRNTTTDYARIRLSNANNGYWEVAGQIGLNDASDRLNFYNNAAGNILSLTGSGNVGIGTTTPLAKLHINGAAYVNTDVIVRKFLYVGDDATNNGTSGDIRFGSNNVGTGESIGSKRTIGGNQYGLDFFTGSLSRLSITNTGNVVMNGKAFVGGNGSNNGTIDLAFGLGNSGEGIGSKRTAGGNQFGLDFYTANGTNRMSITNLGNVGIGTTAPSYKLDVNGIIRCLTLVQTSDRRYKTNIQTLDGAMDKILAMRGTYYDFAADQIAKGFPADKQVGFIAQEMQQVMPELVKEDAEGMLAINYTGVIPVLVEALKEQHGVIEEKETRIAALEAQNTELQSRLARIEAALGIAADRQSTTEKSTTVTAKISPNPTAGFVTVELQNTAAAKTIVVKIMDAAGQEVASSTATAGTGNIQFDLSQFPVGMYVAQIIADGKMVSSSKVQLVK